MKRSKELLRMRRQFVNDHVAKNGHKQMKVIVSELSEKLFVSERTIYNILNEATVLESAF